MESVKAKLIQKVDENTYTQFLPQTTASQVIEEANLKFINASEKSWVDSGQTNVAFSGTSTTFNSTSIDVLGTPNINVTGVISVNGNVPKVNNSNVLTEATLKKGAANGVASLDASGKIPTSQLPQSTMGGIFFGGVIDFVSSSDSYTLITTSQKFRENYPDFVKTYGNTEQYGEGVVKLTSISPLCSETDGVMFKIGHLNSESFVDLYIQDYLGDDGDEFATTNFNGLVSTGDELYISGLNVSHIDNTDAVKSVNTLTGNVVLDASNVNYESSTTIKQKITSVENSITSLDSTLRSEIAATDKDILSSEGTYTAVKVNKKGKVTEGAQAFKVVSSDSNLGVDAADVVIGGLVIVAG